MRRYRGAVGLLAVLACSQGLRAQAGVAGSDLPPTGYGTMSQDELNLRFVVGDLEIRFLPLDERVLRLLANDAYASLHGLLDSRKGTLDSAAAQAGITSPGHALVSFFGLRSDASFDPDNVTLSIRNQLYRPVAILPFTANFNARRLDVRQSATAIYLYERPIPVYEEFQVYYATTPSNAWRDILRRVERERARVLARAQRAQQDSTP